MNMFLVQKYEIQVIQPNHSLMKDWIIKPTKISESPLTTEQIYWNDPVKDRITFRPRARYVYWTYVEDFLRVREV